MSSPRQFEHSLDLQVPRDAVWKALTDAAEIARWFSPKASCDARVGGEIVWEWEGLTTWPLTIETLEPSAHLRARYDSSVSDGAGGQRPLFVDFFLEGDGGRTTLRLVHSGFDEDAAFDDEFDGISSGWPTELGFLKSYLERHAGKDRTLAWSKVFVDLAPEETWARLTAPSAVGCGAGVHGLTPGADFAFETADGDTFRGQVLHTHEHMLCGVLPDMKDAFLRVWVGKCGGEYTSAWLWVASYGEPSPAPEGLEARWDALLARTFEGHVVTPPAWSAGASS